VTSVRRVDNKEKFNRRLGGEAQIVDVFGGRPKQMDDAGRRDGTNTKRTR